MAGTHLNKTLITIPEMHSFDDVRQAMSKAFDDLQNKLIGQLPITNYQGKRISNVGIPLGADDVVTLKYLQSGGAGTIVQATSKTDSITTAQYKVATFNFSTISGVYESSHLYVTSQLTGSPVVATITATVASATGTTGIDIQISTDSGSTWTSLFTGTSYPTLTVNQTVGATTAAFTGTTITTGALLKAQVDITGALDAQGIVVELIYK